MSAEPLPAGESVHAGPRPWLLMCAVLVLVAACYVPVLGAPFIWDDTHLIDLPLVRELAPVHDYFGGSFWQHDEVGVLHNYYRPLTILSLALDQHVYGANPSGFHVTNLLFHLATTGVLFGLLRKSGVSGQLAALASALWGLAPRLTEAAAWVSGRTDVLAGFFVLCALLAQRSRSMLARSATAMLLLLGLFCKETALAGLLAVLVYEWQEAPSLGARMRRAAPIAVALGVYIALRLHAVGMFSSSIRVAPSTRLLAVAEAVGRYASMVFIPWFPDAQIGNLKHRVVPFVVIGLLLCAFLAVFLARKGRRLGALQSSYLVLSLSALGLALIAVPFSISAVAADRFLYLPLAGLVLMVTPLAARSAHGRALAVVALTLLGSFAISTFRRAEVWADEIDFWTTTLRQHPEEPSMSSVGLASAFSREGMFGQSLAVLERAAQPGMDLRELAARNMGTTLLRAGNYEAARQVFGELAAAFPANPVYGLNLALAQISLNRFQEAQGTLDRSLLAAPADAPTRALLERLPDLAAQRRDLDAWPPSAPALARARLQATLGLKREAVESFALVLDEPNATPALAEEATRFALVCADAATRERFFERYVALVGGRTDPQLQLAYDMHRQTLTELEKVWPTLGLSL